MSHKTPHAIQFTGQWNVRRVPLTAQASSSLAGNPDDPCYQVAPCEHLQTALYPDNFYWGSHLRELNTYAWLYQQEFTIPALPFHRARIRCDGIDYYASLSINGHDVGDHEGNFDPFTFDVTPFLKLDMPNTLTIQVRAPWDMPNPRGSYPIDHVIRGMVKGLYEHGEGVIPPDVNPIGIWRPVWLLLDDGISLEHVRIRTTLDGDANNTANIEVTVTTSNDTGKTWRGNLELAIAAENHHGPGTRQVLSMAVLPGIQQAVFTLTVPDPHLWWSWDQGDPNLYRLDAALTAVGGTSISTISSTFGIRTVELERSPDRFTYRLNGRDVFIRGSSYMPGLYLSQCSRDAIQRDLNFAREANLNLIRVHVHVSVPDVYDLCDRMGLLIWQDFELNWIHEPSPTFETRARHLQHAMIALLENHPSIITWACHNEPTMIFLRRENLEQRPDPALYADAQRDDPTRPIFICSGQAEADWQRTGDLHSYYGAIWSSRYTDVYRHRCNLNTEFGIEAPADPATLRRYPEAWQRLKHLESTTEAIWTYQAELVQYHVEHFRRLRSAGTAGYVHFSLVDLAPQVGCGVLDVERRPKDGYAALKRASQPLHISMEHDGKSPRALWVFNDTPQAYQGVTAHCQVFDVHNRLLYERRQDSHIVPNQAQRIAPLRLPLTTRLWPKRCARIELSLQNAQGEVLACNTYLKPFQPMQRPVGYPWKFDPFLGCKVYDDPAAPSLADINANWLFRLIPLSLRERIAERGLRQRVPLWAQHHVARLAGRFL